MTSTFRSVLEHAIGAEGVLSIRLGSGEVRLRAVDGFSVRVRDRRDHDIADMFHVEAAEGSLSFRWSTVGDGSRAGDTLPNSTSRSRAAHRSSSSRQAATSPRTACRATSATARRRATWRSALARVDSRSTSSPATSTSSRQQRSTSRPGPCRATPGSAGREPAEAARIDHERRHEGRRPVLGRGPFTMETVSGDALVRRSATSRSR